MAVEIEFGRGSLYHSWVDMMVEISLDWKLLPSQWIRDIRKISNALHSQRG